MFDQLSLFDRAPAAPDIPLTIAPAEPWQDEPTTYCVAQASPPLDPMQGKCGTLLKTMGDLYQIDIDGKAYWFPLAHLRHDSIPVSPGPSGPYAVGDRVTLTLGGNAYPATITGHTTGEIAQHYPYAVQRDDQEMAYPATLDQLARIEEDLKVGESFKVVSGPGYVGAIAIVKRLETRLARPCIIADINGIEYPFNPEHILRLTP